MHELAVARRVVAIIEERSAADGFASVREARIDIGPFTCLDPEALRSAVAIAARGTCLADARLVFREVPADGACPRCGHRQAVLSYGVVCADCGTPLTVSGGDDLRIAELEVV